MVVADSFFEMPGGSVPEVIAHEYGVQPLLALITAEYVLFTVPFGRLVVVIVMFAEHCDANKASMRERRGSLISPCWPFYRIVEQITEVTRPARDDDGEDNYGVPGTVTPPSDHVRV